MAKEELNEAQDETPDTEAGDGLPENNVTIEDAGEATKKITIEVPRQRIDAKFNEMFGELHESAMVPGFRKGHAPRRLLEKRFGKEVREDVRNVLVSEGLQSAIESEEINMLGEPDIDLDAIELPEEGDFSFSVEVEVQPEFDLPDYKGIKVEQVSTEVTDERLGEALKGFLANRGQLKPVDGPAEEGDLITADVKVSGEGIDVSREAVELRVAPGAVEGIPLEELGKQLAGAKADQAVTIESDVPEGHPEEDWQGKKVTVEITPKEIKRLDVPDLTDELAEEYGFDTAEGFREYVKERLASQLEIESQQQMREQVAQYLLDNTEVQLPAKVAQRQAAGVLRRRYVDLLYRGVPRDQIDQNLELLQARATEQARRDLKLQFILTKIAEAEDVEVTEGEVNARIAQMAMQYGRRPERLRQEMANEGSLGEVEVQIREQKAMDKLLEMAEVSEAKGETAKSQGKTKADQADEGDKDE